MLRRWLAPILILAIAVLLVGGTGCAKRARAPQPAASPPASTNSGGTNPASPSSPATSTAATTSALDLQPVFFGYDSYGLNATAQARLDAAAKQLRAHPEVTLLIEGHCDERGTVEYNAALGERRAMAARDYLTESGIAASRIQILSYGKERPFDEGHDEAAWAKNRRSQLVAR